MKAKEKKVVYIAHGHPAFSAGGAELAAHHLANAMVSHGSYKPYLLARVGGSNLQNSQGLRLLNWSGDDCTTQLIVTNGADYDYFYNAKVDSRDGLPDAFEAVRDVLLAVRPDIVHIQHYMHIGVDLLSFIKTILPDTKIVLTLHEYTAMCANQGLLLKTDGVQLCHQWSSLECCGCFPYRKPYEFFLRERLFKSNFGAVDFFISPSHFLKERYVTWGIEPERIIVLDNGRPIWPKREPDHGRNSNEFRVAFFGQLVFHKGWEVLFKAAEEYMRLRIQRAESGGKIPEIRFSLYGSRNALSDGLRDRLNQLIENTRTVVCDHGPYEMVHMPDLLGKVDCVVVPSIWWENSQLVIQEAYMAGVPIICSDIGGMAEKVKERVSGLHFAVGDHLDLLDKILEMAASPELVKSLQQGIPEILSDREMATIVSDLYDTLLMGSDAAQVSSGAKMSKTRWN